MYDTVIIFHMWLFLSHTEKQVYYGVHCSASHVKQEILVLHENSGLSSQPIPNLGVSHPVPAQAPST